MDDDHDYLLPSYLLGWPGPVLELNQTQMEKLETFLEMHICVGVRRVRPAEWENEEPAAKRIKLDDGEPMEVVD